MHKSTSNKPARIGINFSFARYLRAHVLTITEKLFSSVQSYKFCKVMNLLFTKSQSMPKSVFPSVFE